MNIAVTKRSHPTPVGAGWAPHPTTIHMTRGCRVNIGGYAGRSPHFHRFVHTIGLILHKEHNQRHREAVDGAEVVERRVEWPVDEHRDGAGCRSWQAAGDLNVQSRSDGHWWTSLVASSCAA